MKRSLQFAVVTLFVALVIPTLVVAQSPASVVWNLTAAVDSTRPSVITGNLSAQSIAGTDTFKIRSYSGTPNGPLGATNMRWWPTGDGTTGLMWGLETTENPYRYVQLSASPLAGNSFTADSISIWMLAGGTSGMRVNAYFSTDPTFASKTKVNPGDTAIYLLNSGSVTITTRFAFPVGITVNNGQTLYFRVYPWFTGTASNSKYLYTQLAEFKGTTSPQTGVAGEESGSIPSELTLYRNYPNPFNPSTTIAFGLPNRSFVRLAVFNMLGQEVRHLISEDRSAGKHEIRFDATGLPSGLYLVNVNAGGVSRTSAVHLIK